MVGAGRHCPAVATVLPAPCGALLQLLLSLEERGKCGASSPYGEGTRTQRPGPFAMSHGKSQCETCEDAATWETDASYILLAINIPRTCRTASSKPCR